MQLKSSGLQGKFQAVVVSEYNMSYAAHASLGCIVIQWP